MLSTNYSCFCCNDIPKIEPNDVYEKLIPFSLKSKFVEEEITPQLLKENPYYKKCDTELRNKVNNEPWIINDVTHLIINRYKQHLTHFFRMSFPNDSDKINSSE